VSVSQLKTLTSFDPLLLSYTELQLRVRGFMDAGFSKEIILLLIQVKNPVLWLLF
jgi:hypothetical protein